MDHNRQVDISLVALALVGLVNMVGFFFVWGYFLAPTLITNQYYFYWFAWFIAMIVHEGFWGTIVILWPLAYIGDLGILRVLDFWIMFIMYGGIYGGYEVILVLLVIGSIINIDLGWSFDSLTTWLSVAGYFLLALIDGALCWWA